MSNVYTDVYTDVSTLQVVHAALRDRGLGHAGVQQHQQLPGLRAGGQDYGIIYLHQIVRIVVHMFLLWPG